MNERDGEMTTDDACDAESTQHKSPLVDEIVESERANTDAVAIKLADVLSEMGKTYRADPVVAVRGQAFIKHLHRYIQSQLEARLTRFAARRGIRVILEPTVLGSHKPKDVDVAVVDPVSGPLVLIGVRSQMSSVGKNVLTYYEGIVGECTSLQDRFPMSTHAYIYLHPLRSIKGGKEQELIDHARYARMYAAVTGRAGPLYKQLKGIFDEFAYMVVDFDADPPVLRDDLVLASVPEMDLSVATIVNRTIETFNSRTLFWEVFK